MFHLRYLPLFFLQQLINLFYILRDPVLFTKNLKVGLIPDQHDFLEFPIRMILKPATCSPVQMLQRRTG